MSGDAVRERSVLEEEREFFLRSLQDLEHERAAGDLDEADYLALRDDYTARAAEVLRQLERHDAAGAAGESAAPPTGASAASAADTPATAASADAASAAAAPATAASADAASADTASADAAAPGAGGATPETGPAPARRQPRWRVDRRVRWAGLALGALLVVGGAGWSVAAASGARLPGSTITGGSGPAGVEQLLLAAEAANATGKPLTAVRDYQRVLASQPDNPIALTGEAGVLIETRQVKLVGQAAVLAAKAEQVDASYAPAYAFLGEALVDLGDDAKAVPQLRRFLAISPKDPLASSVRQLLAYAQRHAGTGSTPG